MLEKFNVKYFMIKDRSFFYREVGTEEKWVE